MSTFDHSGVPRVHALVPGQLPLSADGQPPFHGPVRQGYQYWVTPDYECWGSLKDAQEHVSSQDNGIRYRFTLLIRAENAAGRKGDQPGDNDAIDEYHARVLAPLMAGAYAGRTDFAIG